MPSEKVQLKAKRDRKAKEFQGINVEEEMKKIPCKHYKRINSHLDDGFIFQDDEDELFERMSSSNCQIFEAGDMFSNQSITMQRFPITPMLIL